MSPFGGRPLGVGDLMPIDGLTDLNDVPVSLDDTRSGRTAVIVFYNSGWCPYCNATLRAYEKDLIPTVRSRGVAFFAISSDVADGSLTLHELTYDVFSDERNAIARQLGILRPSGGPGGACPDCTVNGPSSPLPTVVIVDRTGVIRWMDVGVDHRSHTHSATILDALDAVTSGELRPTTP